MTKLGSCEESTCGPALLYCDYPLTGGLVECFTADGVNIAEADAPIQVPVYRYLSNELGQAYEYPNTSFIFQNGNWLFPAQFPSDYPEWAISVRPALITNSQQYDCSGTALLPLCRPYCGNKSQYRAFLGSETSDLYNAVTVFMLPPRFYHTRVWEAISANVSSFSGAVLDGPTIAPISASKIVLLHGQTNKAENGIYVVDTFDPGTSGCSLSRYEFLNGDIIQPNLLVTIGDNGAVNSHENKTRWSVAAKSPITIGTTETTWFRHGSILPAESPSIGSCINPDNDYFPTGYIPDPVLSIANSTKNSLVTDMGGEFSPFGSDASDNDFSHLYYVDTFELNLFENSRVGINNGRPATEDWVLLGSINPSSPAISTSSYGDYVYVAYANDYYGNNFSTVYNTGFTHIGIVRSSNPLTLTESGFYGQWRRFRDNDLPVQISHGDAFYPRGTHLLVKTDPSNIPTPCNYLTGVNEPPSCTAFATNTEFAQQIATVDYRTQLTECGCPHLIQETSGTLTFGVNEHLKYVTIPMESHTGPLYWGCEETPGYVPMDGFESANFLVDNLVHPDSSAILLTDPVVAPISITCDHGARSPNGVYDLQVREVYASYSEPWGFTDFRNTCSGANFIGGPNVDLWSGARTFRKIRIDGAHDKETPCIPDAGWVPCDPFDPFNPDCFQPCIEQPPTTVIDVYELEYHQHSYARTKTSIVSGNGASLLNPICSGDDDGFYSGIVTNETYFEWQHNDSGASPPDNSFAVGELSVENDRANGRTECESLYDLFTSFSGADNSTNYAGYLAGATAPDPDTQITSFSSFDIPLGRYTNLASVQAGRIELPIYYSLEWSGDGYTFYVDFKTKAVFEDGIGIGFIDNSPLTGANSDTIQFAWADDDMGNGFTTTFDPLKPFITVFRNFVGTPVVGDVTEGWWFYLAAGTADYLSPSLILAVGPDGRSYDTRRSFEMKGTEYIAHYLTTGNVYPPTYVGLEITTKSILDNSIISVDNVSLSDAVPYVVEPPLDWNQVKLVQYIESGEFRCHPNL